MAEQHNPHVLWIRLRRCMASYTQARERQGDLITDLICYQHNTGNVYIVEGPPRMQYAELVIAESIIRAMQVYHAFLQHGNL